MTLKLLLFFVGCMTLTSISPDLDKVRQDYRNASKDEEAVKLLFDTLTAVGKNDETTLVAYKGAVTTMMAQYAQGIPEKKSFFKEGRELVEYAIALEPTNVEIRCIRLSVQESVPKITGYHKNKEEDKQFIMVNYTSMHDMGAKAFVKGFVLLSESFTQTEKQLF
ncbi:hypothetical protein LCGC14_0966600 [marine sediment metagenome]|uniref:Uncharacterized protein n=2 Tax=root TaxID=1 RepID=A0A831QM96_9FLAO|nr:hypothetical protein [Pricia sp.]HEA19568.1 hypothetical protein [Pricia antarctica]